MRPRALAPALLLVATLGACGTAGQEPEAGAPRGSGDGTVHEPTSPMPGQHDPALTGLVDAAVEDLATRLDVPVDQVTVVSAEAVTWGDTSLGCPQPGMRYAQVVTDGTRIVLAHDGTDYAYHSGGDRRSPFLCEQPRAPVDGSTPAIDRTRPAEDG